MPEVQSQTQTEVPAWVAQLPDDLKQNATFTSYKTIGDLAKNHLETAGKVTELEGRLKESVPKLPDDASDEDRSLYYDALGRPKQPSEYELEGEDKNAPEWTSQWKTQFHDIGLTKTQAKKLSTAWNSHMQKMVDAHNASVQAEVAASEAKLKSEWGDKFPTNVELAKRLYQKYGEGEFDKAFDAGSAANRFSVIKMLVKFASVTGEDRSPQGGASHSNGGTTPSFINYDKSPAPPKRN